jgi:hypothetical protein
MTCTSILKYSYTRVYTPWYGFYWFRRGKPTTGFWPRIIITHRSRTHYARKMPPNDADGLVVSYIPLIRFSQTQKHDENCNLQTRHVLPSFRGRARMQGTAVLRVIIYSPVVSNNGATEETPSEENVKNGYRGLQLHVRQNMDIRGSHPQGYPIKGRLSDWF